MISRYQTLFEKLADKNEGAFVPFVTIGDPNQKRSLEIIDTLVKSGADALELGIPFSDPVADGPVIQQASIRALASGTTPPACFEIIAKIRKLHPTTPIGLLLYVNIVYRNGIENFYQQAANAGVDSILIADLPLHESAPYRDAALKHGIDQVFIAPPNADKETLKHVAEFGGGYTYLLSRVGITGTEEKAGLPIDHILTSLNKYNAAPSLLGFGISEPSQVTKAIKSGAAGAISGSAVVKIIATHLDDQQKLLIKMRDFINKMKVASITSAATLD
ncbi:MAG: tryptophan synthase subunit alpha [Psychromonas sp.]|nr:tryptophan synthase subunit alpha [Psychromonas sp.]